MASSSNPGSGQIVQISNDESQKSDVRNTSLRSRKDGCASNPAADHCFGHVPPSDGVTLLHGGRTGCRSTKKNKRRRDDPGSDKVNTIPDQDIRNMWISELSRSANHLLYLKTSTNTVPPWKTQLRGPAYATQTRCPPPDQVASQALTQDHGQIPMLANTIVMGHPSIGAKFLWLQQATTHDLEPKANAPPNGDTLRPLCPKDTPKEAEGQPITHFLRSWPKSMTLARHPPSTRYIVAPQLETL